MLHTHTDTHTSSPPTGASDGPNTLTIGGATLIATCVNNYVLLAKLDGRTAVWEYYSALWTDTNTLNSGSSSMNAMVDAKLDAYLRYPVQRLRVGMADVSAAGPSGARWLDLPLGRTYGSVRDVMASGFVPTAVGRQAWKDLVGPSASLQYNCNREGFTNQPGASNQMAVRIGILSNQEYDCGSPDSAIGFGMVQTGLYYAMPAVQFTVGNYALWCADSVDNGPQSIGKFGYLLGQ